MSCDTQNMRYDLSIWQGATFALSINVTDANNANINLTSYSASMQIRQSYDSVDATETLSSSNGEITFDTANGIVSLELSADRTANINVDLTSSSIPPKSVYVYDMDLTDPYNKVTKLLFGQVDVYGEVTR
jgi:hypothetical protein